MPANLSQDVAANLRKGQDERKLSWNDVKERERHTHTHTLTRSLYTFASPLSRTTRAQSLFSFSTWKDGVHHQLDQGQIEAKSDSNKGAEHCRHKRKWNQSKGSSKSDAQGKLMGAGSFLLSHSRDKSGGIVIVDDHLLALVLLLRSFLFLSSPFF